jgi:hypothetical protein
VAAHEGAFVIEGEACGVLVFRDADGQVIEAAPALPEPGPSELADPWSLVATDGSPMQFEYVVDAILGRRGDRRWGEAAAGRGDQAQDRTHR